jgi:hypothetical protein
MDVDKYITHMEDSGRKRDGSYQMTPITSFFVKDVKENVLLLSGYSVSSSVNGSAQTPKSNAKVSPPSYSAKIPNDILPPTGSKSHPGGDIEENIGYEFF